MDGAAQLVYELVIFYDVAVHAGVDGRDRGLNGWHAGNQQEKGSRGDLFGKLEKIHAVRARHTNIRNDDVEDLRFELTLGSFHAVRHFHTVTSLPKGNPQKSEDGFLLADNTKCRHSAFHSFDCVFCSLHSASRYS